MAVAAAVALPGWRVVSVYALGGRSAAMRCDVWLTATCDLVFRVTTDLSSMERREARSRKRLVMLWMWAFVRCELERSWRVMSRCALNVFSAVSVRWRRRSASVCRSGVQRRRTMCGNARTVALIF